MHKLQEGGGGLVPAPTTKVCTKCGEEKGLEGFHKQAGGKFGVRGACNICVAQYQKNNERRKEYARQYYQDNKERIKVQQRQYQKNNERKKEYDKQYRKDNRKRARAHSKQWYKNNKEKARVYSSQHYKDNKDRRKEQDKQWRKDNPEKIAAIQNRRRALKMNAEGTFTGAEFIELCDTYGNVCLACGADSIKLTVDHVVPLSKGGSNSIDNIQPLCLSCNCSKGTNVIDFRDDIIES